MALVFKDRIKETTTTTGQGTITLAGAVDGFRSFADIGNSNTTYYVIYDNTNYDFEVGIGAYTASGTTLSRDTVLQTSSGNTTKVNFGAGSKEVFVSSPADKHVYLDGSNNLTVAGTTYLNAIHNRWTKTATNGQTVFTGSSDSGATLSVSAYTQVFINGILLEASDYTIGGTTTVTLASGASTSDIVEIISFAPFTTALALQPSNNLSDLASAATARSNLNVADGATNYADANVDTHLNTSGAGTNHYLKWSGSDYAWSAVDLSGYAPLAGATFTGDISGTNATLTGYLRGPSSFTIDPAVHGADSGTVIIKGDLQVEGTTTQVDSTTVNIADNLITLASGNTGNRFQADASGIEVKMTTEDNWFIKLVAEQNRWNISNDTQVTGNFYVVEDSGNTGGNITLPIGTKNLYFNGNSGAYLRGYTSTTASNNTLKLSVNNQDNITLDGSQGSTFHGNVGIGVTPTHQLHVLTTDAKGFLLDRNTGNEPASLNEYSTHYSLSIKNRTSGSYLNFGGNSGFTAMQATDGAGSATAKNIHLQPYGGNVLIGTGDAGYPAYGDNLTVGHSGDNGITIRSGTSNYGTLYFSDGTGTGAGTYAGKVQYLHSDNSLRLASNSVDRVKLDSSGNTHLLTDSAYLAFGANSEVTLTHVHNQGLALNSSYLLYFNGTNNWIHAPTANEITINSNTTTTFDIGGSQKLALTASGLTSSNNITVSKATPDVILTNSNQSAYAELTLANGSNTSYIFQNGTSNSAYGGVNSLNIYNNATNAGINFYTNNNSSTATLNLDQNYNAYFRNNVSTGSSGDLTVYNKINLGTGGGSASPGSSGQVLTSAGSGSPAVWTTPSSLSGVGGHWTVVSESSISNQTSINYTVGADKWYRWVISGLQMESEERQLMMLMSYDSGSSWIGNSQFYSYIWHYNLSSTTNTQVTSEGSSGGGVRLTRENLPYATASGANHGTIQMTIDYYQPSSGYVNMEGRTWGWGNSNSDSNREYLRVKNLGNTTTTVNYVRFINYMSNTHSGYRLTGNFKFLRLD